MQQNKPILAMDIPTVSKPSLYPEPFASMMDGRLKRKLGNHFSLNNFGVNLTELAAGAMSALKHQHSRQDEFIYILSGTPVLIYGNKKYLMHPGECMGFKAGEGIAHQLINETNEMVRYLEIGDRTVGDEVLYPENDLSAHSSKTGEWIFLHKNGTPYKI